MEEPKKFICRLQCPTKTIQPRTLNTLSTICSLKTIIVESELCKIEDVKIFLNEKEIIAPLTDLLLDHIPQKSIIVIKCPLKPKPVFEGLPSGKVVYITSLSEFDTQLKKAGSQLVVVDYFATWCPPCKMIAPQFEEMAKKFSDVAFRKVDVDQVGDLSQREGVTAMPTFMFYKNGKKVGEIQGADIEAVKQKISKLK